MFYDNDYAARHYDPPMEPPEEPDYYEGFLENINYGYGFDDAMSKIMSEYSVLMQKYESTDIYSDRLDELSSEIDEWYNELMSEAYLFALNVCNDRENPAKQMRDWLVSLYMDNFYDNYPQYAKYLKEIF